MQVRLKKSILLLSVIALFSACSKYPKRGQSINKGDIIDNYAVTDINTINLATNGEYVIKDQKMLDSLLYNKPWTDNTNNSFDFNQHSIIGKYISGGCKLSIIRDLCIDHSRKRFTYTIRFRDAGICFAKAVNYNLVIVPKIPDDYTVVVHVKETR